jgi:hypothetical protein
MSDINKFTTKEVLNKVLLDSSGNSVAANSHTSQEALNAVLDVSNSRLNVSLGGSNTISGDVTITGDLTVQGNGTGTYDEIVEGNLQVGNSSTADSTIIIESSSSGDPLLNFISTSNRSALIRFTEGSTTEGLIIYEHNGDNLKFVTGSANASSARLTVNETSSHFTSNLGIGTATSPESLLHIESAQNATMRIHNTTTGYAPQLLFEGNVGTNADNLLGKIDATWDGASNVVSSVRFESGADTSNKDDGVITFWTSPSSSTVVERMRIDSSGNVGIGVTPSDYFASYDNLVVGATSGSTGITIVSGDDSFGTIAFADGTIGSAEFEGEIQYRHSDNTLSLGVGGNRKLIVDSSGNISLGSESPYATQSGYHTVRLGGNNTILSKSASAASQFLALGNNINRDASGNTVAVVTDEASMIAQQNGKMDFYVASSTTAGATISFTQAMHIANNGNIQIGGGESADELLHLKSSTDAKPVIKIEQSGNNVNGGGLIFLTSGTANDNDDSGVIRFKGMNDAGTPEEIEYATIYVNHDDVSDGSEDATMHFRTQSGGSLGSRLVIQGNNVGIGTTSPKHYSGTSGTVLSIHDSSYRGILELSGASNSDGGVIGVLTFANTENTAANGALAQIYTEVETSDSNDGDDSGGHLTFFTKPEAGSLTEGMRIESTGNILPGTDDAQDLGSSSKRFDDIHATNGTIQTSDERLKDNIADSSLGLDFVNALRPVKYQWKDYSYDVEKEEAVEAKEAEYETVVVQEAVEAKEAVMGTRQKTVSKEVEKTRTEIVEEDGKYVQKEISYTETVKEPQYEEVNLYDEDGNKIQRLVSEAIEAVEGVEAKDAVYEDVLHKIPVMEEYEVEPAVEAVEEVTEERLVSEAIEAKDAVMETKEKTFARTHFGLIAQEVEQVLKDSSLTNNDFAGLIYDEDSDRYGMRYHELIAPLIKAVQELSAKVEELEKK